MSQQRWKVSIAIHGIVANYEATVSANSEAEAEEKVRQMYEDDDRTNGEVTEADFTNAFLSDDDDSKNIEEAEEDDED
jgi:hypothetical protein